MSGLKSPLIALFLVLLACCSLYDIKKRIIPNVLAVLMACLGVLYSSLYDTWYNSLIGMIIPALPMLLLRVRQGRIGAGDIKLISAIGAWVGWLSNLYILLAACILALIFIAAYRFGRRMSLMSVAFAPFLSSAVLLVFLIFDVK